MQSPPKPRAFLTQATEFTDVSRGDPKPYSLEGDALINARLTRESWRLEIVPDDTATLERPLTIENGRALDLASLESRGATRAVHYLKALQCNNIDQPLGQGLWEGIPLRDLLELAGKRKNVRRLYYYGFHNNDPNQIFQSSLAINQVLDSPPGELPPFVAYRLNGQPIPLVRGGPVRLIVPWAHGFKSVKWLMRVVLTNDHEANDTYAGANNDPESYLKTAAYIDAQSDEARVVTAGQALHLTGTAIVGWPGLDRVEYWLRPLAGNHGHLADDDPAWSTAAWKPCRIELPPADWSESLPAGAKAGAIWGFDRATGNPRAWPMRFSVALWAAELPPLPPGGYEFRVRTVDQNGFAQPQPRPGGQSGRNLIQCQELLATS